MRPMLAARCEDTSKLRYPVLATPKIDGIRCLIDNPLGPVTRSLKLIPNVFIRNWLKFHVPFGFDGELTVGKNFQMSTSGIMSFHGEPDFTYHVFDIVNRDLGYLQRIELLKQIWIHEEINPTRCKLLVPIIIENPDELLIYEESCLAAGFEGAMIRTPDSPYKFGRSTLKEQWLVKIKRFEDAEAVVIGFEELEHNANPAERNELGYQERSTHKANMVGMGMLGALVCKNLSDGVVFNIGSGFDEAQRHAIWDAQPSYLGKIAKYKFQRHGTKDRPRIPIFHGFRDATDMDDTQMQGELFQ